MKKITNCIDCPQHRVIPDPDLNDSFNYDDVAVVCVKAKNEKQDVSSKYVSDRQEFKQITVACRPYKTREESDIPEWCPEQHKALIEKIEKF